MTHRALPVTSLSGRGTVLGILTVVYISSYLDRQILAILLPQIKAEFNLSDAYLGLLSGLAFALFYTTLGLPLARIADSKSRVNLLTICIAVWSLMTALCGMATNFVQLLLARIGVGVGEAGCNPSAHSMIADYFPLERRATALSVYATGVPIGALLGLALGGWLGDTYGWRVAFVAVGAPGLVLAVLVKLFLKEPPRGFSDASDNPALAVKHEKVPLGKTFATLWRTRSFRIMCFLAAGDAFVGYGLLLWLPTYLIRSFELSATEVGLRLGLMIGIAGLIGTITFGYLTDRLGRINKRFYCWMPAVASFLALLFNIGVYNAGTVDHVFWWLIVPMFLLPASGGPIYAAVQSVVPAQMRATAAATLLLALNLVGLGFGPTFIGFASDLLTPTYGDDALRRAMLLSVCVYLFSGSMAYLASRYFVDDVKRAQSGQGQDDRQELA